MNWDPKFQTAISDLEVENREVQGHMWHFKYPLAGGETYTYVEQDEDGNVLLEEERDYISIATTRPETMLGDGAVAVHPDDERYRPIVGKLCEIPVGPKEHRRLIPIITDDYPDPNFGSGAVKITGAHDLNDYGVAQRNGIPMYRLMDGTAHMRSDGPSYEESATRAVAIARGETASAEEVDALNLVPEAYRGLDRYDARKAVVADIDAEGLMIKVEDKLIMQPFGDRSGVVIEPMLTDQWYVDAATLAKPAIEAVRIGRHRGRARDLEEDLVQLAREHPALVRVAPALVGPPHPGLVRRRRQGLRRRDRGGSASSRPAKAWRCARTRTCSTPGSPRRCGRSRRSAGRRRPHDLKRHYPNDVLISGFDILFFWDARMAMQGFEFMGERAVEDALPPRPGPRRARARRCPSRRAIRSIRSA